MRVLFIVLILACAGRGLAQSSVCIEDEMSLRAGPEIGSKLLTTVSIGEEVTLTGQTAGDYVKVKLSGGEEGWTLGRAIVASAKTGILAKSASVYSRPNLVNATGTTLEPLTIVAVAQTMAEWTEVVECKVNRPSGSRVWLRETEISYDSRDRALSVLYQRARIKKTQAEKNKVLSQIHSNPSVNSAPLFVNLFADSSLYETRVVYIKAEGSPYKGPGTLETNDIFGTSRRVLFNFKYFNGSGAYINERTNRIFLSEMGAILVLDDAGMTPSQFWGGGGGMVVSETGSIAYPYNGPERLWIFTMGRGAEHQLPPAPKYWKYILKEWRGDDLILSLTTKSGLPYQLNQTLFRYRPSTKEFTEIGLPNVFCTWESDPPRGTLGTVNPKSGKKEILLESSSALYNPIISSDWRLVVYQSYVDRKYRSFVLDMSTKSVTTLDLPNLQTPGYQYMGDHPDGGLLTWVGDRILYIRQNTEIRSIRPDGTNDSLITKGEALRFVGLIKGLKSTEETVAESFKRGICIEDAMSVRETPSSWGALLLSLAMGEEILLLGESQNDPTTGLEYWKVKTGGGTIGWTLGRVIVAAAKRRILSAATSGLEAGTMVAVIEESATEAKVIVCRKNNADKTIVTLINPKFMAPDHD